MASRSTSRRSVGTACIWPRGVEQRYDISAPTRCRGERQGLLPARDVYIGGRAVGWRPETLETAERGGRVAEGK